MLGRKWVSTFGASFRLVEERLSAADSGGCQQRFLARDSPFDSAGQLGGKIGRAVVTSDEVKLKEAS